MAWYDSLTGAGSWLWEHSPGYYVSEYGQDAFEWTTDKLGITKMSETEEAYEDAQETLEEQMEAANEAYDTAQQKIEQNRQAIADIIGPENVEYYKNMVYGIDPGKYGASTAPITGFEFERDVSKYMDPAAKYQIDESVKAALQGMTGQGGISGGAAARALQAEASQKASELYGEAWDRMMKETEQEYGKARDTVSAEQAAKQAEAGMEQFKTGQVGNLFGSYVGNLQSANEDIINLLMAKMGSNLSLSQALAQLKIDQAAQPTWLQQMMGMGGEAAKMYAAFA